MRKFLSDLNDNGQLLMIKAEIDPREISAIISRAHAPVLMEKVSGYDHFSIASGFFTRREMIAKILNCPEKKVAQGFNEALKQMISPVEVATGPVKERIMKGTDVDLTELPIPLMHVYDGAPYITGGIVIAKDPLGEFGTNLGMYRLMYRTKNTTGIDLVIASDLRTFYQRALTLNKPLPISVAIGVHPALMMAASYKAPLGLSEYEVAGGIQRAPVELTVSETNNILVPAHAEIVLEGEILPIGWVEPEGPFGEFAGYQGEVKWNPVVKFNCITLREKAIYYALGMPWENVWLQGPSTEVSVLRALINAGIKVHEVRSTTGGACFWQVLISIEKRAGEGKNALLSALSVGGVKYAVVTDSDVNIYDQEEVDKALVFRVRPAEDVVILQGLRANHIDPTVEAWKLPKGELPVTSKIGIDATIPEGIPLQRYQIAQPYGLDSARIKDYFTAKKEDNLR